MTEQSESPQPAVSAQPQSLQPVGSAQPAVSAAEVAAVFRAEHGRAVAVLARVFGDLDIAEDSVQEAFAKALEKWPDSGLPPSPAGWIITTARNGAIDRLRRESSREDKHAQAALLHAQDEPVEEGLCATTGSA